jgi:hypothetical protein
MGGNGGAAYGGKGGDGGDGGFGLGGGISELSAGLLTIKPRQGARTGSRQSRATSVIRANHANAGLAGMAAGGGATTAGSGGTPNGTAGQASPGGAGKDGLAGVGVGGGLNSLVGKQVTLEDTTITGNTASTAGDDVGAIGRV